MVEKQTNHPHPSPPPEGEGMFFLSEKEFSFPLRGKVGMGVVSPVVSFCYVL
jgi:hypothetical protein